jgi:hypothetical protein
VGTGLLISFFLAASLPQIDLRDSAYVAGPDVMLEDLAVLDVLPSTLRLRASKLVVFRLEKGQSEVRITDTFVAARVRALLPGIAKLLQASSGHRTLVLRATSDRRPFLLSSVGPVKIGSSARVEFRSGIFRIQREVAALEGASPGQDLFVRTRDGQVFSVRCCEVSR